MIEYIKGDIAQLNPTDAVIECNGIGYLINISLYTFSALEGYKSAKLLIHESIREDAHQLFGFINEQERHLFRQLIGVSGVGANTARIILSSIPAPELEAVIASGDDSRLKSVKGIGTKTAQRIIVDLRDKIKHEGVSLINQPTMGSDIYEEALAALVMLGFNKAQSQKALKKIFADDPTTKVEAAIKKALSMM